VGLTLLGQNAAMGISSHCNRPGRLYENLLLFSSLKCARHSHWYVWSCLFAGCHDRVVQAKHMEWCENCKRDKRSTFFKVHQGMLELFNWPATSSGTEDCIWWLQRISSANVEC